MTDPISGPVKKPRPIKPSIKPMFWSRVSFVLYVITNAIDDTEFNPDPIPPSA